MKYLILFFFVSCASVAPYKNDYRSQAPELKGNFLKAEDKPFDQVVIEDLLSKKIARPEAIKVAVLRLNSESEITPIGHLYSYKESQGQVIKDQLVSSFKKIQGKDKKIKEIVLVPTLLLPKEKNLRTLRDVAAILQADILLVLDIKSKTDSKFHVYKKNEAKANATIEAVALDVRTGAVPWTSITTNSAHIREDGDFSNEELYLRATVDAENNTLAEIIENFGDYFN